MEQEKTPREIAEEVLHKCFIYPNPLRPHAVAFTVEPIEQAIQSERTRIAEAQAEVERLKQRLVNVHHIAENAFDAIKADKEGK